MLPASLLTIVTQQNLVLLAIMKADGALAVYVVCCTLVIES